MLNKVSEIFANTTKQQVFDKSIEYWNSGKTKEWLDLNIDLVIGKREGYYFERKAAYGCSYQRRYIQLRTRKSGGD